LQQHANTVFRDREFIRTGENLYFCVVDELHPKDRVISYLRYAPSTEGKWGRGEQRFARAMPTYSIPNLLRNIDYLKTAYPDYVFHSDIFGVEMSAVPLNRVAQHYLPQVKLKELSEMKQLDSLQRRVVELVDYLSEATSVGADVFGVTGSILIDLHNPEFSDIDLTVLGGANGLHLKKALPTLYSEADSLVESIPKPLLRRWYEDKLKTHPLNLDEVKELRRRQWNYNSFKGTIFSLHTVRAPSEIYEKYGDRHFHSVGIVTGRAVISDASESLFNPHIYKVENFKVDEGMNVEDISEVSTYSGLFGGIFEEGETILVHGKLELVEDMRSGANYHRIVIGSPEAGGHDYIKPIG
jgi:predicted nucleotidyltransferase